MEFLAILLIAVLLWVLSKKKKAKKVAKRTESMTVTFKAPITAPDEHTTWNKKNGNSDNDYANAVFLSLHKRKAHKMNKTAHLGYLSYKLGIHDPVRKYKDMLKEGYFRKATDAEILDTYKVQELKEILENHGHTATGKKADLITAITENIPSEKLKLPELYSLASKGWEFIKQHDDLIKLFGNPYKITYEEYMAAKNDMPSYHDYSGIVWGVFNRREFTFSATDDFERRYNAFYRAEFLRSEGKFYKALHEYILVIYYDVNQEIHAHRMMTAEGRKRHDLILNESLAEVVYSLKEYYDASMIDQMIIHYMSLNRYIDKPQLKAIIEDLLNNKNMDFGKYAHKRA